MTLNYFKSRVQMAGHAMLGRLSFGVANYRHPSRASALRNATRARALAYTATTPLECVELDQAVRATCNVPGDMAEVGVYLGGTAAVILNACHDKHLHLFDTFAGLPDSGDYLVKGEYAGSIATVRNTLSAYAERITLHPGLFPQDTGRAIEHCRFSFVHLDMDLYEGTLGALQFFWPRMNVGGIILSHDYPQLSGIVRAFDEFFSTEQGTVVPLSGQQCIAVKLAK